MKDEEIINITTSLEEYRKKYNIVVYNRFEPFVDPKTSEIRYGYSIKRCNKTRGWNFRQYIGDTHVGSDPNVLKAEALEIIKIYLQNEKEKEIQS